ncbi:MAG: hypothetical protein PHF79_00700 [Candidatus Pacebacteria bacterium]|nr:hypothetical protein [Candidatus Paceibacterota bacterium]
MFNFKFNNSIKLLKKINLTSSEKRALRSSFIASAGMSPDVGRTQANLPIKSPFSQWQIFLMSKRAQVVFASLAVVLLVGGSTVFAANRALPGDILYPVKTGVNEKVARFIHSVSPASEATFELGLVNERLQEAEQLNQKNALNPENKVEIKKEVIDQTVRAVQASVKLDQTIQTNLNQNVGNNMQGNKGQDEKNNLKINTDNSLNVTAPLDIFSKTRGTTTLATTTQGSTTETVNIRDQFNNNFQNRNNSETQNQQNRSEDRHNSLEKVLEKHQDIIKQLDLGPKN